MPAWKWDERRGRYRDPETGRVLSPARIRRLVDEIVDRAQDNAADLAEALEAGDIDVAEWELQMAYLVEDAYIQQAELAAGGEEQTSPWIWAAISLLLSFQFNRLSAFALEIARGRLTIGQIVQRVKMYVNSSRQAFWAVADRDAYDRGMVEERWIAVGDENTCNACLDADQMGWRPLGTFAQPGSGQVMNNPMTFCVGLTNCRCWKDYR